MKPNQPLQGKKEVKAWAGITEGKIDVGWLRDENFHDTTHAIYKTKKEAQMRYEQVVPCTITYEI